MNNAYILLLALTLAGCSGGWEPVDRGDFAPADILPNADLSLLTDHWYGEPVVIRQDLVFAGTVTANDESGNFFRSFIVDDGTGAVEVKAGFYDLHNLYPVGRRVVIRALGLALGEYNGVMQLGAAVNDYSSYRVEEFGTAVLLDRHVVRDTVSAPPAAIPCSAAALDGIGAGRLVEVGPLRAADDAPECWAAEEDAVYSSYAVVCFSDAAGDTVRVATSRYADFAAERVPRGEVVLTGIVLRGTFGGHAQTTVIKLRDRNDVEEI